MEGSPPSSFLEMLFDFSSTLHVSFLFFISLINSILLATIGIDRSSPHQTLPVAQSHFLLLFQILLDDVLLDEYGMLTLVHLDHPKALEGADDVLRLDAGHLRDVPDLQIILLGVLGKEGEKDVRPVRPVRYLPQITQRLLRTSGLSLPLAQLVRQADYELAVAALLILREG